MASQVNLERMLADIEGQIRTVKAQIGGYPTRWEAPGGGGSAGLPVLVRDVAANVLTVQAIKWSASPPVATQYETVGSDFPAYPMPGTDIQMFGDWCTYPHFAPGTTEPELALPDYCYTMWAMEANGIWVIHIPLHMPRGVELLDESELVSEGSGV